MKDDIERTELEREIDYLTFQHELCETFDIPEPKAYRRDTPYNGRFWQRVKRLFDTYWPKHGKPHFSDLIAYRERRKTSELPWWHPEKAIQHILEKVHPRNSPEVRQEGRELLERAVERDKGILQGVLTANYKEIFKQDGVSVGSQKNPTDDGSGVNGAISTKLDADHGQPWDFIDFDAPFAPKHKTGFGFYPSDAPPRDRECDINHPEIFWKADDGGASPLARQWHGISKEKQASFMEWLKSVWNPYMVEWRKEQRRLKREAMARGEYP